MKLFAIRLQEDKVLGQEKEDKCNFIMEDRKTRKYAKSYHERF